MHTHETFKYKYNFHSVQLLSRVQLFATPWTTAHQASLSITNSRSLLKLISIESVMPSRHLLLSHPLLHPSNEYSGLISFRMDWLDLLAVQGMLKTTPQFKIINSSALFLYGPTLTSIHDYWKNHSLD